MCLSTGKLQMASQFDGTPVVIDAGSRFTKAGFAGEAIPRCVVPTTVGRFRRAGLIDGISSIYCGNEAVRMRGVSKLTWPIEQGLIKDWEEMEKFWHHIFYKELYVPPENSALMHSVHSLVPRKDKERMSEVLFEQFAIKGLYLAKSPVLVLHASGRTSGLVWEDGYSSSSVTPVFEGFPLKHATITSPLTGERMTSRLQKLLAKTGYSFTTPFEIQLLDRIKAELCYVASDYPAELEKVDSSGEQKVRFDLPDGQHILMDRERFQCPECLFQPSLEQLDCHSLPDLIHTSVEKCDIDYKSMFYDNIVIAGGTSMFPGLTERLAIELKKRVVNLSGVNVNIDAMPSRQFTTWVGGSLLASLDTLRGFWLTKEEYEDCGPEGVSYKFF